MKTISEIKTELLAARALSEKATPGPWKHHANQMSDSEIPNMHCRPDSEVNARPAQMSDTPETDAICPIPGSVEWDEFGERNENNDGLEYTLVVVANTARKLERERDDARKALPVGSVRLGVKCDDRTHHSFVAPKHVVIDFYNNGEVVVLVEDHTGKTHVWEATDEKLSARVTELEAQIPRWIPVGERLPDPYVAVIASGLIDDGKMRFVRECAVDGVGKWRPVVIWTAAVTHWQPMPKGPAE